MVHKRSGGHDYFSNGFLASKKDGKIISQYVLEQENRLNKSYGLGWGEIGAKMLTPIVKSFSKDKYYLINEKSIHPIPYQNYKEFFSGNTDINKFISKDTYAFMLFNNLFPNDFKSWTRERIMNSNILISKIFKKAMED